VTLLLGDALEVDTLAELFARLSGPLFAYAMALMLDRSAAEDVVQRAFELAISKRQAFRPGLGSAEGWLFGITRHVALDERRRVRRRASVVASSVPAERGGPDLGLERADHQSVFLPALRALDRTDREVIALKFWADRSNGEIGALLGCSESNVGTRLHRAIRKLRESCDADA
jgi:RNA polymerase sigma-70 factor, ECF subfamily